MIATTIFFFTQILLVIAIFLILSKLGKRAKNIWTLKRILICIICYIALGLTAFIYISFFQIRKYQYFLLLILNKLRKNLIKSKSMIKSSILRI